MPENDAQTLPDAGRDGDAWPRWQAGARRDTGRPYRDPRPVTPDHRRLMAAGRFRPTGTDGKRNLTLHQDVRGQAMSSANTVTYGQARRNPTERVPHDLDQWDHRRADDGRCRCGASPEPRQ